MKYELLKDDTIQVEGRTLYRIRILNKFDVKPVGKLGGYIESEDNLSHEGTCWVYEYAMIYENAKVYGDARVFEDAKVCGNARVYGNARVGGDARVYGNARVHEQGRVDGNAIVREHVRVCGNAEVGENVRVQGDALIQDSVRLFGNIRINKDTQFMYLNTGKYSITLTDESIHIHTIKFNEFSVLRHIYFNTLPISVRVPCKLLLCMLLKRI